MVMGSCQFGTNVVIGTNVVVETRVTCVYTLMLRKGIFALHCGCDQ